MEDTYLIVSSIPGENYSSVIGCKEPVAHPCNCRTECSYGFQKSYCFPCMAKILSESRATRKKIAEV